MSIKSFKHKGLKLFYEKKSTSKIKVSHKEKLNRLLTALDAAIVAKDMDIPGFDFHDLSGNKKNKRIRYSVSVNGNWRITFEFENGDAYILDYEDYH